jgi:uncharacterized protein (TIGR03382 family)
MTIRTAVMVLAAATTATTASAQVVNFTSILNGLQEVPANASPATGAATMSIDLSTLAFTIDLSFSGLSSGMTIAHIHRAPAGSNGPIVIWLDGMNTPTTTPTIPMGATSFSGTLTGTWPAIRLPELLAGNTYFNIHTGQFPGGEIRGQIIPTPGAAALLGLAGLAAFRRRR